MAATAGVPMLSPWPEVRGGGGGGGTPGRARGGLFGASGGGAVGTGGALGVVGVAGCAATQRAAQRRAAHRRSGSAALRPLHDSAPARPRPRGSARGAITPLHGGAHSGGACGATRPPRWARQPRRARRHCARRGRAHNPPKRVWHAQCRLARPPRRAACAAARAKSARTGNAAALPRCGLGSRGSCVWAVPAQKAPTHARASERRGCHQRGCQLQGARA